MISFDNTKTAFEYKNDKELKKAYLLFKLIGMPTLSSIGMKMATLGLKLNLPITGMIKSTVFDQFCGGETISDSEKTMNKLAKYGVHSLLDYSVEGKESESDFNSCSKMIQKTISIAKDNDHIPFAVFKVTGVMRFALLEKLNAKETLTEEETLEYEKAYKRIDAICKKGFNLGVPVMIDAEESWIQDAIDEIVEEMMAKYNKAKAVIYNTVQMYRHDRLKYLKDSHDRSRDGGYFIGVKIVRGAYMEKERARAIEKGYESPIQPNKDATDRDYNLALEYALENHAGISICAGTHNEYSSLILTQLLDKYSVEKDNPTVYFAQLLGMSDHISFNLSKEHYRVVKYVPFGPVKDVMPYLIRRAEENTSISGQSSRELLLLKKEKQRRKI
ncbi:MAG: proline dehydrogenase family protein [Flavobacteriales bacterium]